MPRIWYFMMRMCWSLFLQIRCRKPKADKSEMVITFASADVRNVSARIWVYPDSMEIASYIPRGVAWRRGEYQEGITKLRR